MYYSILLVLVISNWQLYMWKMYKIVIINFYEALTVINLPEEYTNIILISITVTKYIIL